MVLDACAFATSMEVGILYANACTTTIAQDKGADCSDATAPKDHLRIAQLEMDLAGKTNAAFVSLSACFAFNLKRLLQLAIVKSNTQNAYICTYVSDSRIRAQVFIKPHACNDKV